MLFVFFLYSVYDLIRNNTVVISARAQCQIMRKCLTFVVLRYISGIAVIALALSVAKLVGNTSGL